MIVVFLALFLFFSCSPSRGSVSAGLATFWEGEKRGLQRSELLGNSLHSSKIHSSLAGGTRKKRRWCLAGLHSSRERSRNCMRIVLSAALHRPFTRSPWEAGTGTVALNPGLASCPLVRKLCNWIYTKPDLLPNWMLREWSVGIEGSPVPLKGLSSLRNRKTTREKQPESPQRHCVVAPTEWVNSRGCQRPQVISISCRSKGQASASKWLSAQTRLPRQLHSCDSIHSFIGGWMWKALERPSQ